MFTSVISFEAGTSTSAWRNTFGAEVKDTTKMYSFLRRDSGRTVPAANDLLTPQLVDTPFLNYAQMIETLQSGWEPASGTKLYQIAGTGIDTPSGITYFTDTECLTRSPLRLFACSSYGPKLGYRVNMVLDGDGTVVVPSALSKSLDSGRVERWWLNLFEYNDAEIDRDHKNIFEVPDVINFIGNIIQSTTSRQYTYLTNSAPAPFTEKRLSFYLHSPLDLSVRLSNGDVLSSSTRTISGGVYRRYGELQYISLPDTSVSKTLILNGQAGGSFTLDIEQQQNGITTKRQTYSAIPTSSTTKVTVGLTDSASIGQVVLVVDYDGNGTVDINYNEKGILYSYAILTTAINSLTLKTVTKKVLLEAAKVAEQNYQKSLTAPKFRSLEKISLQVLKQIVI